MGVVYRAYDTLLEREVALKIISASIEGHSELRERFYREARAAGQLSHRNVITIHDLGEHEGQPYLAMELLKGEDLQHRLTRPDPMSLARKLEIASEICDGLGYAHRRGLIHRDIKPANIFITDEGVVKLLDFGLARMVTSELTRSNVMLGTLNYMAPEQVRGERIDHRADIFSFGVVLYEILSGRKAFQGDSFATTLFKILQDVPEPLLNIDATLPHEVVRLVERAIAKNREERYQDLAELAKDLALQRQHLAVADHPTSVGTVPPAYQLSHPPTLPAGTRRPESARPKSSPRERDLDGATTSPEASTISAAAPVGLAPPGRRSPAPRVMAFGAALALVAVFGGLYWITRLEDTPARQATIDTPSPQPAQAAPPPPETVGPKVPVVSTPPATSTAPPTAVALDTQVVQEARDRMTRAKGAAVKAGPSAQRSRSFTEALAAEREGLRHHQSKRMADAVAKFYEATGLFHSAAASAVETATPSSTARVEGTRPPPPGSTSTPGVSDPPAATPQAGPPNAAPTTPAPPPQPDPAPTPAPPPLPIPPATRPSATPVVPAEAAKPAEDGVRELVRRYELALEARSVEALKRVWPSLQGAQEAAIRQEFSHARRIDVEIAGTEITMAANAATVTFLRRYQLSTVDGQRLLTNSRTTLNARQNGDEWIIERVRFEAVK